MQERRGPRPRPLPAPALGPWGSVPPSGEYHPPCRKNGVLKNCGSPTSSPQPRFPTWDTPLTPSSAHLTCLPFPAFEVESPGSWKDPQLRPLGRPPDPDQSCTELQAPPHLTLPCQARGWTPAPLKARHQHTPRILCATLTSRGLPSACAGSGLQPPPLASPVRSTQPHCPDYLHRVVFDYVEPDQGHRALAGP